MIYVFRFVNINQLTLMPWMICYLELIPNSNACTEFSCYSDPIIYVHVHVHALHVNSCHVALDC